MQSAQRFDWSAGRARSVLSAILLVGLVLFLVPVTWGLPSWRGWAPDEIEPQAVLKAAAHAFSGGWTTRYPPLHYYLLDGIYRPLRWLAGSERLALDENELNHLLFLAGRLLSVLMATAAVYLVYRLARELTDRFTSCLAAATAATMAPLAYYAKTANLEAPYLFWFALSLLFFLRVLRRQRLRDYLAFAVAGVCALSTKDQAYALYVLPSVLLWVALHRHLQLQVEKEIGVFRALLDRRIVWSLLAAMALFAAIHRLPFDLWGFRHHIAEMSRVSAPASEFGRSPAGYVGLALSSIRHTAFVLGLPLFLAALAGVGAALSAARRHGRWLALLLFIVSYEVFFIALVRYNYDRFYLPVGLVLSIFAGAGLARLLRWRPWPAAAVWASLAVVFGFSLLRGVSVDAMMLADSRYVAESWLAFHLEEGETAVALGRSVKLQPRGLKNISWAGRDGETVADWLREYDTEVAVAHLENVGSAADEQRFREFRLGDMNYRPLASVRGRPLLNLLSFAGVRSNLTKLNAEILLARRQAAWGLAAEEILQRAAEAVGGASPRLLQRVKREIAVGPVPGRRQLLGSVVVALSGDRDRPISGTRAAAVVVTNPGDRPLMLELSLALVDTAVSTAARIRVEGESESSTVVVAGGSPTAASLPPVPGRSSRVLVLTSEGGPPVLLRTVVRRFVSDGVWAAGLGPDLWSAAGRPVVVVVENPKPEPRVVEMDFQAAPGGDQPLRLAVDDFRSRTWLTVPAGGGVIRSPLEVAPYSRATYVLSALPEGASEEDQRTVRFRLLPTSASGR